MMKKRNGKGQYGIRRIGKRAGTVGYLNDLEKKAKPFVFGYGTVWATSLSSAKIKLKKELKRRRWGFENGICYKIKKSILEEN